MVVISAGINHSSLLVEKVGSRGGATIATAKSIYYGRQVRSSQRGAGGGHDNSRLSLGKGCDGLVGSVCVSVCVCVCGVEWIVRYYLQERELVFKQRADGGRVTS